MNKKNEIREEKLKEYQAAQIEQTKAAIDYLAMMMNINMTPEIEETQEADDE